MNDDDQKHDSVVDDSSRGEYSVLGDEAGDEADNGGVADIDKNMKAMHLQGDDENGPHELDTADQLKNDVNS